MRQRAEQEWQHPLGQSVSIVIMEDIMNVIIHLTVIVQQMVTECYKKTVYLKMIFRVPFPHIFD